MSLDIQEPGEFFEINITAGDDADDLVGDRVGEGAGDGAGAGAFGDDVVVCD